MPDNGAGDLRERLNFQIRDVIDDGFGNQIPSGDWETQFTRWANLRPLRGGETITAARMEGRQPFVLRIRYSQQARGITVGWQISDARNPDRVFAVNSPPADPDGKRKWLEMLVTEGQAS